MDQCRNLPLVSERENKYLTSCKHKRKGEIHKHFVHFDIWNLDIIPGELLCELVLEIKVLLGRLVHGRSFAEAVSDGTFGY